MHPQTLTSIKNVTHRLIFERILRPAVRGTVGSLWWACYEGFWENGHRSWAPRWVKSVPGRGITVIKGRRPARGKQVTEHSSDLLLSSTLRALGAGAGGGHTE